MEKLIEHIKNRVVFRLVEDAEQDNLFRQQARKVYNELVEYLQNGGKFIRDGPARCVKINWFTDLEQDIKDPLKICWYDEGMKNDVAVYIPTKNRIDLAVLSQGIFDTEDDARFSMMKGLQNHAKPFMHEYIHHLDDKRTELDLSDLKRYKSGDAKRLSNYFTDPIEVNAYFQAGLAQVEELLDDPDLAKQFMQGEWNSQFREFKDWFFENQLPLPLITKIDSDQEKRLINRLYGFWKTLDV